MVLLKLVADIITLQCYYFNILIFKIRTFYTEAGFPTSLGKSEDRA